MWHRPFSNISIDTSKAFCCNTIGFQLVIIYIYDLSLTLRSKKDICIYRAKCIVHFRGGACLKSCRNVPNLAATNQQMLTLRGNYSQNSVGFPVLRHCHHASSLKGLLPNGTAPSRSTGDKRVLTVLTTTCHVPRGNFMNSCHICHVDHLKIICLMVLKNLAICIKTFKILWYNVIHIG